MTAKFISLEGIEGAGKSTAITTVTNYLNDKNISHVVTREPGGTAIGEKIRNILLDAANTELVSDAELLLMFAARAQHIHQVINPALVNSNWVVCDRFIDATYAYQGGGRQTPFDRIETLENLVQGELRPDLVLLLDIDPEIGMQRVDGRGKRDRFENEKIKFFESVREAYLQRAKKNPSRYAIIDAAHSLEHVSKQIRASIDRLF